MSCEDIPSLLDLQKVKKHADDFGRLMGTGIGTSTNGVTGQVRPTFNKVINDMRVDFNRHISDQESEFNQHISDQESEFNQHISDQESEFNQHISGMAFTRVGTFLLGAKLDNLREVLLWDVADGGDGHEYGWTGVFPKVVPPGNSPLTTGGFAPGAWVDRTDATLRSELATSGGAGLVGYSAIGVGFAERFLLDKIRESAPSVADFCNESLRTKIINGTATNSDAPAILSAINSALSAALSHPTKSINFGAGVLLVSGRVVLPDGLRRVFGAGKHQCTIKLASSVNDYTVFSENTEKCFFAELTIDGNFSENPTGLSGFYSLKSSELDFFNVTARNCGGSGFFSSSGGEFNPSSTSEFRYYGCEAYNNGGNFTAPATTGFNLNADEVVLVSCRSAFNGGGGFKTSGRMVRHYGSYSHNNSGNGFSNDFATQGQGDIFHYGSIAEDNEFNALYLSQYTNNVELHGFIGRRNGQCGLYILNSVNRVKLFGGDLRNNGKDSSKPYRHGVLVRNTATAPTDILLSGVTITDDQSTKTQQYGVFIDGDSGQTSTANRISITGRTDLSGNYAGAVYNNSIGFNITASHDTIGLAQEFNPAASANTGGVTTPVVLESITVPAYELGRRGGLRVTAICNITGTGGNKQISLKVGNATTNTLSATTAEGGYVLQADLYVASSTSMRGFYESSIGGAAGGKRDSLLFSTDINSNIVVQLIATASSASDIITSRVWKVERLSGLY